MSAADLLDEAVTPLACYGECFGPCDTPDTWAEMVADLRRVNERLRSRLEEAEATIRYLTRKEALE